MNAFLFFTISNTLEIELKVEVSLHLPLPLLFLLLRITLFNHLQCIYYIKNKVYNFDYYIDNQIYLFLVS